MGRPIFMTISLPILEDTAVVLPVPRASGAKHKHFTATGLNCGPAAW
jgi:hypothetical protein